MGDAFSVPFRVLHEEWVNYENSKYISNLFFVMLYTSILDDSIKSSTLILTADHSTLLFLPGLFYQLRTSFFFCGWTSNNHEHIFAWPFPF